jgi:hypothetical protein
MPDIIVAPNAAAQTEFQGAVIQRITTQLSGSYTASANGNAAGEAGFGFGGRFVIVQNEQPIIDIAGEDLRFLAGFRMGTTAEISPGALAGIGGFILAQADLPLDMFVPGTRIDARQAKVVRKAQFGPLSRVGDTALTATGFLKTGIETGDLVGESHYEPLWKQGSLRIDVNSSDIPYTYRCGKVQEVLSAIMIRQFDASELLVSANAYRNDTLVRGVWMVLQHQGVEREIFRASWGEIKHKQQSEYAFPRSEVHVGVSMIMMEDLETEHVNNGLVLDPGDVLTVHLITNGTSDAHLNTQAVNAAGDECILTFLSHTMRGVAAGEGDENRRKRAAADLEKRRRRAAASSIGNPR